MEYYLNIGGKQRGPFDLGEVRELARSGELTIDDYVWDASQGRWVKINDHKELARVLEEEATFTAAEGEGFFINVEGKTGGPFPRDAIIKEIERGRFKPNHFVWDAAANKWVLAGEHVLFGKYFGKAFQPATEPLKKYYLSKNGARFGPFAEEEVAEKIRSQEFGKNNYVWDFRQKKWVKLGEFADFQSLFAQPEVSEPAVPPPLGVEERPLAKAPTATVPPAAPVQPPPTPGPPPPTAGPAAAVTPLTPPSAPRVSLITTAPPAGAPPAPPVVPAAPPEPGLGDIVPLSFPNVAPEAGPTTTFIAPPVTAPTSTASSPAAEPRKESGVKIDTSVVLDFSKPAFIKRVGAQLVDLFFISWSYFIMALIFSFLDMNPFMPGPDQYYYRQLFWSAIGGVALFYFLVRDAGGASIGKKIMGLRVVKYDDFNRRANLLHSIIRNLTLLLPLVNILEVVYVLTDVKGRRLGDRAVGTVLTEATEIDYVRQKQGILDEIY